MPFEFKGSPNLTSQQAYQMMKGINKDLRDRNVSDESQLSQVKQEAPRTVNKQSGFFK